MLGKHSLNAFPCLHRWPWLISTDRAPASSYVTAEVLRCSTSVSIAVYIDDISGRNVSIAVSSADTCAAQQSLFAAHIAAHDT